MAYVQKVVHLEINGEHYYFGSISALCHTFSKEVIGVSYGYLRHVHLAPDNPFQNKKCIIRVGPLVTSPQALSMKEQPDDEETV